MSRFLNWILFSGILIFMSCDLVYFDRIPGTSLPEIPEQFRGEYISYEISARAKKAGVDSSGKFHIKTKSWIENNGLLKETFLSDSVVFSGYNSYLFLSTREENKYWNCYILEKNMNGFVLYPVAVPNVTYRRQIKILKKYFENVEILDNGGKKDKFLVKMNEERLLKYYNKKLKQINHYQFETLKK